MEQKVIISDLSTVMIPAEEVVNIIVVKHPSLQEQIMLDAGEAEVKPLMEAESDYVLLELRKGDKTKSVVVDIATFNSAFKDDPYQALANGRPVKVERTGNGSRSNAGELAKIREWAASQGIECNAKGRIKAETVAAYHEAQAANPAA